MRTIGTTTEGATTINAKKHWEIVYRTKAPEAVSWYCPHLDTSMRWIARAASDLSASIIDVGGGEATLVDDLVNNTRIRAHHGFGHLADAIEAVRQRLGGVACKVSWFVSDVTQARAAGG